jgi:hypothetical protein
MSSSRIHRQESGVEHPLTLDSAAEFQKKYEQFDTNILASARNIGRVEEGWDEEMPRDDAAATKTGSLRKVA